MEYGTACSIWAPNQQSELRTLYSSPNSQTLAYAASLDHQLLWHVIDAKRVIYQLGRAGSRSRQPFQKRIEVF